MRVKLEVVESVFAYHVAVNNSNPYCQPALIHFTSLRFRSLLDLFVVHGFHWYCRIYKGLVWMTTDCSTNAMVS